jgi:GNAT superfamily N-acetyltransferase
VSAVELRDAVEADVEGIFDAVWQLAVFEHLTDGFTATIEDFRRELFGSGSPFDVVIAELDGDLAGIAISFPTFATFTGRRGIWLEDLFVLPHARQHGVASALLDELTRRSPGVVQFDVLDWNERAIRLYEAKGAIATSGWTKYTLHADG